MRFYFFLDKEAQQQQKKKQSEQLYSYFGGRKSPNVSRERKRELDESFFKMIYMDYEPLSKGEREGMRQFGCFTGQ